MIQNRTLKLGHLTLAVRISEGEGPPIVLGHGNSCSQRCYQRQFESALARRHRLIAFDLPGHGDSPPAPTPETDYTLEGYARAFAGVARALEVERSVFVGWSLGGHALVEAMERLPEAAGFVLVGAPPVASAADVGQALSGDPALQAAFRAEASDEEARALIAKFVAPGSAVPDFFFEDFRRADPRARACLAASLGRNEVADEAAIVSRLTRPLAILHGVEEGVVVRSYFDRLSLPTLWRGAVQEIAGAGHAPHWETPETFNALLEAFTADCAGAR